MDDAVVENKSIVAGALRDTGLKISILWDLSLKEFSTVMTLFWFLYQEKSLFLQNYIIFFL